MTAVVALGGGHGLAATLRALALLDVGITAVVGTGDDGGSSGRLREHLGVPPPGDLRMALVALTDDGLWPRVLQHRFGGTGDVEGHALGNLLLVALWEETGDVVAGLDRLGRVLDARGRVLPNSVEPVDVVAEVRERDSATVSEVRGQARITSTVGTIESLRLDPAHARSCPEAVAAITRADAVVFGPGSWFTSVLPHLLVPGIAETIASSPARRVLVVNSMPQKGETQDFAAHDYLDTWARLVPQVGLDVVLVDPTTVHDMPALIAAARRVGAEVHLADLLLPDDSAHDPVRLAAALEALLPTGAR